MVGAGQNSNILHFNTIEDMNKYNTSTTNIGDKAFVYDIDNTFYNGIFECEETNIPEAYGCMKINSITYEQPVIDYTITNEYITEEQLIAIRTKLQEYTGENISDFGWKIVEKISDTKFAVCRYNLDISPSTESSIIDFYIKSNNFPFHTTDYNNAILRIQSTPNINFIFKLGSYASISSVLWNNFWNLYKDTLVPVIEEDTECFSITRYIIDLDTNQVNTEVYNHLQYTGYEDYFYCEELNFANKNLCFEYLNPEHRPNKVNFAPTPYYLANEEDTGLHSWPFNYISKVQYEKTFNKVRTSFTTNASSVIEGWFYGSNGIEQGEMMNNKSYSQEDINKFRDRVNTYYEIEGMNKINTSTLNNCVNYFINCHNLTIAPNFDTSNVTNMSNMFKCCNNLITVPNYNTANVTNMTLMFGGIWNIKNDDNSSYCNNLVTVPNFNTINVTSMQSMFFGCRNLVTVPNFDTSNVTGMYGVFDQCYNLISVPNFNMSKVTTIANMFNNCQNLTTIPKFDTSNVTNMWYAFHNCKSLTSVPNLNYSKLNYNNSSARCIFANCTSLVSNGVINTLNLPNYDGIFVGCSLNFLKNLKLKPNISISEFFAYRQEETIDMSLFSNANINNTNSWYGLFYLSVGLKNVTNVNSNNIVNMYWMFDECHNLISAPIMNTSKVVTIGSMFYNCSNLIDVPQYNTAKVTNMYSTFYNCNNLSDVSIQNIINMCLNSNITNSTQMNLSNANSYSPFRGTNITNLRYQNRLSELTAKGWSY